MPGDGHGKRRSLLHDGAYKRLHGASLLRCIVTCPERQRCNRHAGLVPASNFPRALMSEARWTPEQVRGVGAARFWGKPRKSKEHPSELRQQMRTSFAVFAC